MPDNLELVISKAPFIVLSFFIIIISIEILYLSLKFPTLIFCCILLFVIPYARKGLEEIHSKSITIETSAFWGMQSTSLYGMPMEMRAKETKERTG